MKLSSYLLILPLILCSLTSTADTKVIRVVTDTWLNATNKDGSGYFFDLLRTIYDPYGIQLNIEFAPYPRALVKLSNGDADVTLGVYSKEYDIDWYGKYPVGVDIIDAVIPENHNINWQVSESLKGNNVVGAFGSLNDEIKTIGSKYQEARSVNSMIKMLVTGRVDAILGYKKDFSPILISMNLDKKLIIKEGVFRFPIYFVFHNSSQAIKYKNIFDIGMKRLIDSGELKTMLTEEVGNIEYYPHYDRIK